MNSEYLPTQKQVNEFDKERQETWIQNILENRRYSRGYQFELLAIFTEMCIKAEQLRRMELDKIQANVKPVKWHWAGRFEPEKDERYSTINTCNDGIRIEDRNNYHQKCTEIHRSQRICCELEKEAEFIARQQIAYLEVIDKLKELNEGWKPDWKDAAQAKYQISYVSFYNEIYFHEVKMNQYSKNELYSKNEAIGKELINQLGKEKIILALWEEFE